MPRRHRPPVAVPPPPLTRGEADRKLMRSLVDLLESWRSCHRACRRRKACASRTVACFDHNIAIVRRVTAGLAAWPRLDGPRDPAALVEPVDDLLD